MVEKIENAVVLRVVWLEVFFGFAGNGNLLLSRSEKRVLEMYYALLCKSINFTMIACPFMIGEIIRLRGNRLSFGPTVCKLSSNSSPRDFNGFLQLSILFLVLFLIKLSQIMNVFHRVKGD
jgi:hypothetical protein